jgi:hypothetical protein
MPHTDRRHLGTPSTVTRLDADTLVQTSLDGEVLRQFRLEDVRQLRLSVEMAGEAGQVVCRVMNTTGQELVFGSMAFKAPGVWDNHIGSFQPLLEDLHRALAPFDANIHYVEGQSFRFRLALFTLGAVITALTVPGFFYLFFGQQNRAALFMLPAPVLGIWLMRAFWPKSPDTYDPARYRGSGD